MLKRKIIKKSITNKVNHLLMIIMIVSLNGCMQKAEPEVETNTVNTKEDIQENREVTDFQAVNEDDIAFQDDFVIPDYETICTEENNVITQSKGFFAGTDTNWYMVENNGIVYFYYQFLDEDSKPLTEPTYLNFAIVGEQYTLQCGIHVGMTEDEVYTILPDCINCKLNDSDGTEVNGVFTWNVNSFPEGWCESYCDIIIANIEYSGDLPWYLGIMTDKNGIVKAITTCYPTAG